MRLLPLATLSYFSLLLPLGRGYGAGTWPGLAAGAIGFAAIWALVGQEQRIRRLERKLNEK
ncbi:MAG TPA: hypothetical protein VN641_10785 [Urbifossiella sp.]|nr:hypothetical protein [Urbifossiella sp.]